ncbi:MAG: hypothetical protein LBV46_03345 [Bacteroidales bacterium]|jgi:hypothetical protein|nr:hypothetical protein [Bacteroidales bacterium]
MKTIKNDGIVALQLMKPDFQKAAFELKMGTDVHSSVTLLHDDGTLARVAVGEISYTAKRCGFFRPYVTLRKEGYDNNEAVIFLNVKDGSRCIIGGESYYFKLLNLWKNQWGWALDTNQVILRYKPCISGTLRADVEVTKDSARIECIDMLAVLGVYFLGLLEQDVKILSE